ncbi:hypothetical protein HYH03_007408 [Edaphochlamys debaryana]|uniref:Cdc23 domain-containing protein n=1 Tax=Edaphochlamys debaryana TaxID=47281 RepID=A0A836BYZ6_9CHLO|nr:hypothetical protein HYH03_007408 [Edaphochlamys debaryana]|eukprot:KAG2494351.1 hypothetical protein HYH03_007408 [Edaphochlamys debaryana]
MFAERHGGASVPSPATPSDIAAELTQAVHDLNARGLFQAAQWAAEQLVGLELHDSHAASSSGAWHQRHGVAGFGDAGGPGSRSWPTAGPSPDPDEWHPQYLLARCYFQNKEFRRAAHALTGLHGPLPTFLRLHATLLAGEKRKEEERIERGGLLGRSADVVNPELEGLEAALTAALGLGPGAGLGQEPPPGAAGAGAGAAAGNGAGLGAASASAATREDPFLQYLYGVVLAARGRPQAALAALASSLRGYPCNWSAWMAVQSICSTPDPASAPASAPPGSPLGPAPPDLPLPPPLPGPGSGCGPLPLPPGLPAHWSRECFQAAVSLALQHNQEALSRLQGLAQVFRGSLAVEAAVAQAHYNLQNFEEAQALYEDLLARDPYRIEGTDTFSNILFVTEAAAPLSVLAHRVAATDRYRPESCCVLGNYYSLQGSHEKAVECFRRALRLDPRYLAAWTLMGHEYMEVKNTPAAIDAYRRAIDVSPLDFRAWYGLGQAYELLKMPFYALYYYRRAAQLRPTDARMWCALAQCYAHEQVGLQDAAIRAYQRAVAHNDPDGIAGHKLAKLYESRGELDAAERLFRMSLQRLEAQGPAALSSLDALEALSFLAVHCKDTGRLDEAEALCARLMDAGGPAKERAKALAREVRALQQFGRAHGPGPQGAQGTQGGAGAAGGAGGFAHGLYGQAHGQAQAHGHGHVAPMDADSPQAPPQAQGAAGGGRSAGSLRPRAPSRFLAGLLSGRGSIFAAPGSTDAAHGVSAWGQGPGVGPGGLDLVALGLGLAEEGGAVLGPEDAAEELQGCDPLAVLAVMQQLQFERSGAVAALLRAGGDPVAAVRGFWYPGDAAAAAGPGEAEAEGADVEV